MQLTFALLHELTGFNRRFDRMPVSRRSGVVAFGIFEVNAAASELRKHGVRVRVPRQPLAILLTLLERPGEIVSREELRRRLWPDDTFVDFEHGSTAP